MIKYFPVCVSNSQFITMLCILVILFSVSQLITTLIKTLFFVQFLGKSVQEALIYSIRLYSIVSGKNKYSHRNLYFLLRNEKF